MDNPWISVSPPFVLATYLHGLDIGIHRGAALLDILTTLLTEVVVVES